ncbi:MAG: zinc-dependent metalloprotease [Algibacter sp.]
MKKIILIALLLFCTISTLTYAQGITSTIKPYNEIITSEVVTKKDFLQVHLLKNKLYLEIPLVMLNQDMLFVKHDVHSAYKQMKWIKSDDKIHLIIPEIQSRVGNIIPVIKGSTTKKITPATFPIMAMGRNKSSYVIDATSLFLNPPGQLPGSGHIIFDDLMAINKVIATDNTIEVKTTKTITSKDGPITVDADFSLLLLPEPMMPRLFDHRMGFGFEGSGSGNRKPTRAAIARWRLEKKHPNQAVSDPIKAITLYFDPATPAKLKPYLKAGVEAWLPAFEDAGFKNAIVVKEPPVNDKNWSLNSMRYSYIRWFDETHYRGKENYGSAGAGIITDHRTGEILKGDVLLGGGYNYLFNRYFVRCSPLDARAQKYPFPDDLMGELFQSLIAHEVGHVFGLRDGNYGEYMYPFEKMRDKVWLERMGHTPSMMNYARENFIIQPEDHIPPALLHQKVGPTDLYSIRWGYTPFNDAHTPDDELPYLEKIVSEQNTIPWYRFRKSFSPFLYEPETLDEIVESSNPIKATALGIQNLKRVLQLIPSATQNERGDQIKKKLYKETLNLWVNQMKMVVSLIGGHTTQHKSGAQEGTVHNPIPASRQKEAVAFLIKEAFHPPLWMAPPNILNRLEVDFDANPISNSVNIIAPRQIKILEGLLSKPRLENIEVIRRTTKNAYSLIDLLEDLHEGLWSELKSRAVEINPYRQEMQMAYITMLKKSIETENPDKRYLPQFAISKYDALSYTRGVLFSALKTLEKSIEDALKNTKDSVTKAHLELCLLEIKQHKS